MEKTHENFSLPPNTTIKPEQNSWHSYLGSLKSNYLQLDQEECQNWKYHWLVLPKTMLLSFLWYPQTWLSTAPILEVSTDGQRETLKKPSGLAHKAEKETSKLQRQWRKSWVFFLLFLLNFLTPQPPVSQSCVRSNGRIKNGRQQKTAGAKTLEQSNLPLDSVKLQPQEGREKLRCFLFVFLLLWHNCESGQLLIRSGTFLVRGPKWSEK